MQIFDVMTLKQLLDESYIQKIGGGRGSEYAI